MTSSLKQTVSRSRRESIDKGDLGQDSAEDPRYGLNLLYDGADVDHPDVDFVAVHGLRGHPLKSFTDAETGCCWLRDLLPSSLPHCRVLSYGYGDLLSEVPVSLYDIARELLSALAAYGHEQATKRPRIFICHSIGGLVVKRALIEARLYLSTDISDVYRYTIGLMFFGTLQRASSWADSRPILPKVLRAAGFLTVNQDLLHQVKLDSGVLNEINQGFSHLAGKSMLIGSFYETQPTKPLGIIIDRSSAILNLTSEYCVSLKANHAEICTFKGPADANYRKVLNLVKEFRNITRRENDPLDKSLASLSASHSQASLPHWIPCVASKQGTTSMGLLEMGGSMEQPKDYLAAEMDIIAVHGLGGSPVRSWVDSSSQTMWLREMLQVDVPNTRVMSYGYRTEEVLRGKNFTLYSLANDFIEIIMDARARIQNTAVRIAGS